MQKGDLVYIMGDPSRPILGKRQPAGAAIGWLEPVTHGTPALVLELDGDVTTHLSHIKVLVQGEMLWMPSGFVKVSNEEG
jgi:hypothetical protein